MNKTIFIVFLTLGVGIIGCHNGKDENSLNKQENYDNSEKENRTEEKLITKEEEKLGILRIENLFEEYESNKLRFAKKYNEKLVKIKGEIKDIEENGFRDVVFYFKYNGILFNGIYATFDQNTKLNGKDIIEYSKGDEIIAEGVLFVLNDGFIISCVDRIVNSKNRNYKLWTAE
jgi:hypothetical protein